VSNGLLALNRKARHRSVLTSVLESLRATLPDFTLQSVVFEVETRDCEQGGAVSSV
jgi:hypothetical protein